MAAFPNVNDANKYARDIVAGKIPACKWVKLTCQNHLDDLAAAKKKGFPFYFSKEAAEAAILFVEALPHTKGEWARLKKRLEMEPWQKFIFACVFGWKRKTDKTRRYREIYCEVPRKNGKSVIAAGIGLLMFTIDGEFGAEVYSIATNEKQAWEVFKPAKLMVDKTPQLKTMFGIETNASNMNRLADGAKFEPLIGNPGDGASPSCAIVDEYHEHKTSDGYDTMITGMGARKQPLMLIITTAGSNIAGPCYDKRREVIDKLSGTKTYDDLWGIIYTIDDEEDWDKPEALQMANPNFDISVGGDWLLQQQKNAIQNPAKQNIFKTKHLNAWVAAKAAWLNITSWNKCADKSLDINDFKDDECWFVVDLAHKIDICATGRLYRRLDEKHQIHYYYFPHFYLPEKTIFEGKEKNNLKKYQTWLNAGYLESLGNIEINFELLREDIVQECEEQNLQEVVFDPWRAAQIGQQLENLGMPVMNYPNQVKFMSPAMKEMEAAIESGRFHHPDNPVLNWMAANVTNKEDKKQNYFPDKEKAEFKIDGIIGAIMGIGRAMYEPEVEHNEVNIRVI
ncbi:MAG: terminase TerL endonuclease subunit [Bermanella sp.]